MGESFDANAVVAISSAAVALLTIGVVVFAALQLRQYRNLARCQFLHELDRDARSHLAVYQKLAPGGAWFEGEGPKEIGELVELMTYIGFYEKVYLLMEKRALDIESLARLLTGRFFMLVRNPYVRRQIIGNERIGGLFRTVLLLEAKWLAHLESRDRRKGKMWSSATRGSPTDATWRSTVERCGELDLWHLSTAREWEGLLLAQDGAHPENAVAGEPSPERCQREGIMGDPAHQPSRAGEGP